MTSLASSNPAPQFSDARACRQWLAALPLTNIALAHTALTTQLEQLNRAAISPLERLKISELLREPVAFVQQEMARKYVEKPLPFEAGQRHAWNSVAGLWAALDEAYRLALRAGLEGDQAVAGHIALLTQRRLRYVGLQMLEHYRAQREVEQGLWQQAHQLYALAERQDYALHAVKDDLNTQAEATTCGAAYARILLTDLADPYSLTARQLALLERWLDKWALRVSVAAAPPDGGALAVVGVDLGGAAGPVMIDDGQALDYPRYLDTEQIALTLRKRIKRLRKGESPAALGLGEGCAAPDCEALLASLYQRWCVAAPKRRLFTRPSGADQAQVALGMAAIHFFLGGEQAFKPPGEKKKLSQREIADLQFFGRISEQTEKRQLSELGFALETWHIEDESALGLRLLRAAENGLRVSRKQLVAVRPADGSAYALGVIERLLLHLDDGLDIGVRLLPGAPRAIAARPVPLAGNAATKYVQAFLLPDMPVLGEAASVVLPAGWFAPGRVVEIHSGEAYSVRLISLVESGSDYERAGFVRV